MRIRSYSLLSWWALTASLGAQELPPYDLPAEAAKVVRAAAQVDPFVLLARLGGMDLEQRAAAEAHWQELDERTRCALVRAGLRSMDGPVALGAAAKAGAGRWLDTAEQKRAAAVGLPRCNVEYTAFDVGDFFEMLDAQDTAAFLSDPGPMPREMPTFFGPLHHRFGPEHFAALEQLARGDDVLVREGAGKHLGVVRVERLRYANYLLSRPDREEFPQDFDPQRDKSPFVPRGFTLRPAGDGYPPLLAAVLERVFLAGRESNLGDATFAWRWARDSAPGAVDRPLLEKLLASEDAVAQRIGVVGLAALGGADAAARLRAFAAGKVGAELPGLLALASLAKGGDAAARTRLGELGATEPLALAVAFRVDRDLALPALQAATGPDAVAGLAAWELLEEAAEQGWFWGVPMEGLDALLVTRCEAAALDGGRLAYVLAEFPGVRSKKLASLALAALAPENVEAMPLGVLELVDGPGLARRLHELLAASVEPEVREQIVGSLVRLGSEGLGDAAATERLWQAATAVRGDEERARALVGLAGAGNAWIRDQVRAAVAAATGWPPGWWSAANLAATATAGGLDARLGWSLAYRWQQQAPEAFAAELAIVLEPLRAGDARRALASLLATGPAAVGSLSGLWTCRDPVALAYLQRCRDEREHGLYCWATGELARAGDAAARAEIEGAITRRLYGWINDLDQHVLTDGKSLARVPLLLQQVESNCCTFAVVASALEDVFEVDAFQGEQGVFRRPEVVRDAWQRWRDRLRWSRIADRWLVAPM